MLIKYQTRKLNHYYNHVDFTNCPMYLSLSIYSLFVYLLVSMNYYHFFWNCTIFSLFFVAAYATAWISEIYTESIYMGQYTAKVYSTLMTGFVLFVLTEFLVFFGFFWALFDRYFNMTSSVFSNYSYFVNYSERIGLVKPLQGLFCLYFSGSFCNVAHYLYFYGGDFILSLISSYIAIILGFIFLYIQYEEFNHLIFTINDHVVNSSFYLLAGFHVSIGLFFLITQHDRMYNYQFTRSRHFGFVLAMIYWHFVDIVWFFLFYVFYIMIFTKVGSTNSLNFNI